MTRVRNHFKRIRPGERERHLALGGAGAVLVDDAPLLRARRQFPRGVPPRYLQYEIGTT